MAKILIQSYVIIIPGNLFVFFQDYRHFGLEAPPNIPATFFLFRDYGGYCLKVLKCTCLLSETLLNYYP